MVCPPLLCCLVTAGAAPVASIQWRNYLIGDRLRLLLYPGGLESVVTADQQFSLKLSTLKDFPVRELPNPEIFEPTIFNHKIFVASV